MSSQQRTGRGNHVLHRGGRGGQRYNNRNYRGNNRRRGRGRGHKGGYRGRGRRGGTSHHRNYNRNHNRNNNRTRGGSGYNNNRSYNNNKNDYYRNQKFENELNLSHSPRDIERFNKKWDRYTEQQTLSKIISDIPLMALRKDALFKINNTTNTNTDNNDQNNNNPDNDKRIYVDGYEVGPPLKLTHIETSILDQFNVKYLGDCNWNLQQLEDDTDRSMADIIKHVSIPANDIPVYASPTTPFRMWRHRNEPKRPYKFPLLVPISVVAFAALKYEIDVTKYDFVSLRRSVKRILSFSDQLNTNFQCINGVIFAEDVPITKKYAPYNYGYQLELHCIGQKKNNFDDKFAAESKESDADSEHWPQPFHVLDPENETEIKMKMKQEEDVCVPLCKTSDYYHLLEVNICDLKLLLLAEIDCLDDAGVPMEIKFGSNDKPVSIWSQCFLSGMTTVIRAQKTFQTLCTVITNLTKYDVSNFYGSETYQNAQLMVFYNILKDIKQKLSMQKKYDVYEDKDGDEKEYVVSDIYRVSRHRSHTEATMFKVEGADNLISKQHWKDMNVKDRKDENKNYDEPPPTKKRKLDTN